MGKKWQQAYSYHIEQGKKYSLAMRIGKITEKYQGKLIGIEWTYGKDKYISVEGNANDWLKFLNQIMDKRLDDHFQELIRITGSN